jgi:hypothetical protein
MISLAEITKRFWFAAFFIRRGQCRDRSIAIATLRQLSETATGKVQGRAAEIMKDLNDE